MLSKLRLFSVIKVLISTLLGVYILYFLFKRISPLTVITELKKVNMTKLVFAVVFITLSYFCRAILWKKLMDKYCKYNYLMVFRSTMIGYLMNNILPARLGDVTRGAWLLKIGGGKSSVIFGTLALERIMDVSIVFIILVISFLCLGLYSDWLLWSSSFFILLVTAFFVFATVLRWLSFQDISFFPQHVVRFKEFLVRKKVVKNPRNIIKDFGNSLSFTNMKRGIFWSVVTWFVTFWGIYFALDSLGLAKQLGFIRVAMILSVASLGIAIPSLPASLGTYQAAFVFGSMLAGVSEAKALSASFLYHGLWIVITSILGLVCLMLESNGLRRLLTFKKKNENSAAPYQ